MFLLLLLWLCFGLVFVLGKMALEFYSVLDFIFLRMIIAGSILLALEGKFWKSFKPYKQNASHSILGFIPTSILLLITSVAHMLLPFILEYNATMHLHPTKISLIYSLSPFITAIISIILLQERITILKGFGLILGWLATMITIFSSSDFNYDSLLRKTFITETPELTLLCAIISASFAWFLVKELMDRNIHLSLINGSTMFIAGIGIFIFKNLSSQQCQLCYTFAIIPWQGWSLLICTMTLSNFIGYPLYSYLLKSYSATALSLSGFMCPIFTTMLSYIILGSHELNILHLASFILGLLGLGLYQANLKE